MAGISIRWVSVCARVAFGRDAGIPCGERKDVTGLYLRGLDEGKEESRHRVGDDGGEQSSTRKLYLRELER